MSQIELSPDQTPEQPRCSHGAAECADAMRGHGGLGPRRDGRHRLSPFTPIEGFVNDVTAQLPKGARIQNHNYHGRAGDKSRHHAGCRWGSPKSASFDAPDHETVGTS